METAAVASILWDRVLVGTTRRTIAAGLGISVADARSWALFLAGVHDLGKASPPFQKKWEPAIPVLRAAGYQFPEHVLEIPHGRISAIVLKNILHHKPEFGLEQKVATALARLTGGHHGIFDSPSQMNDRSPLSVGQGLWEESRLELIRILAHVAALSGTPNNRDMAAYCILGGLITVSDWIASAPEHFPYRCQNDSQLDPIKLFDHAAVRATNALTTLGWLARLTPSDSVRFESLFSVAEPRPLQNECIGLAETLEHPSLVIIEAPMGEGKTEAALFLAERLRQRFDLRGVFVGLPTQATSNQMFTRVAEALSRPSYSGAGNLLLMHGHASLSAEFNELRQNGYQAFAPREIEASEGPSLAAGEWFTHRKRGLLADFGVGTVDQVLMAALQSKHVFVRLAGLAGKIVVIDEVHAYDTYMSALLERLIEWLKAIGSTVVLLSATLPAVRRAALVNAFSPAIPLPLHSYPSLTIISDAGVSCRPFVSSQLTRNVSIESVPPDSESVADWAATRIENGGCAAVVCNTVTRAQEIFKACRARLPGLEKDGFPTVELLHSRFPFERRQELEIRSIARFGKPGSGPRPGRALLVATQVIEQSLDLDFDLLVSELAPVDLLLQRTGRLHRHDRPLRPTGQDAVLGLISTPLAESGMPSFPRAHTKVYDEHILLRTHLAIGPRRHIRIPDDIQPLVEQVYSEAWDPPESEEMQERLVQSREDFDKERLRQRDEAGSRYLPDPKSFNLQALTEMGRDDDENVHKFFQALTRLVDKTATVVCLFGTEENAFLDPACSLPATLQQLPDMKHVEQLLRRSCSLSHRGVIYPIEASAVPSGWRKSVLLRNCHPLIFDSTGACRLGGWTIILDDNLGLTIEKAPDA